MRDGRARRGGLGHEARKNVRDATCGKRHDNLDRPIGIIRLCNAATRKAKGEGCGDESGRQPREPSTSCHGGILLQGDD